MAKKADGEKEFRLRPNRPPKGRKNESIAWSVALKTVFRYASTSRRRASNASNSPGATGRKQFNQRCAVRITYTKNKVSGQWRAHGRYIARESAAQEFQAGFNSATADLENQHTFLISGKSKAIPGCGNLSSLPSSGSE